MAKLIDNIFKYEQLIRGRSSSEGLWPFRSVNHDHILPVGWFCKFDPKSKRYYFIRESDDEATTTDSSSSTTSEEWKNEEEYIELQPSPTFEKSLGKKIKATSEKQANIDRICEQFPDVDRFYVKQLTRLYKNRENLVISALLAQNYNRKPVNGNVIVDEALYYKIRQSFPHIESEYIRKLLIQNENREHPTIEALLNLFGLFNTTRYKHSKKPQLKLKYLKFAFPKVDEIMLLDLLFKNDFDAGLVIKHLQSLGHEHSEVIEIRMSKLSETALLKEANERLQASRPKSLIFQDRYHPNLWEQEDIRKNLIGMYPTVDIFLINWALESTKFDQELASTFLQTMTPQNDENYMIHSLPDKIRPLKRLIYTSRQIQTNSIIQDLFGHMIIVEIYDENKPRDLKPKSIQTIDKCISTQDDNDIGSKSLVKKAVGPEKSNKKGPDYKNKITKRNERIGPICIRNGPDLSIKQGPKDYCGDDYQRATRIGAQKSNKKGSIGRQLIRYKELHQENNEIDESIYFDPEKQDKKPSFDYQKYAVHMD